MKTFEFQIIFHWNGSLYSNWQYVITGLDNGLAPNKRQASQTIIWINIWINDGLVYWCIFASLSLNELILAIFRIDITEHTVNNTKVWQSYMPDNNLCMFLL